MVRMFLLLLVCLVPGVSRGAEWSKQLPNGHRSRYFNFHYQRAAWDVGQFARFADGFVDLVNRDFLTTGFAYPIEVLVLPDREWFQQFLRTQMGVTEPSNFGMYFASFKVFVTYETSGYGTFAHEIMHPLVQRNLPDAPEWATEAIPAFFEKFIGYWDGNRLVAEWGYQNPWRIDVIGDKLVALDLAEILDDRRPVAAFNNSARRLVTVFLWQHGKLRVFLRAIAGRSRSGYRSYFEAAMNKPLSEIVPLWQRYLADVAAHRSEISRIPASVVLRDASEFERVFAAGRPWRQVPVSGEQR